MAGGGFRRGGAKRNRTVPKSRAYADQQAANRRLTEKLAKAGMSTSIFDMLDAKDETQ